jgi:quercetin dioxygenase-like cupin family protein
MNNKEYTDFVEQEKYPADPLVPLDPPFINAAGSIQNLTNCKIGAVAVISSVKGSERSNHWHRGSWHYLHIISGRVKYFERNLDGSDIVVKEYGPGQMFFTPPNKVHKTEFLEDTILISLGRESKDTETHEKDIVREKF